MLTATWFGGRWSSSELTNQKGRMCRHVQVLRSFAHNSDAARAEERRRTMSVSYFVGSSLKRRMYPSLRRHQRPTSACSALSSDHPGRSHEQSDHEEAP